MTKKLVSYENGSTKVVGDTDSVDMDGSVNLWNSSHTLDASRAGVVLMCDSQSWHILARA
jgi:hypothetical protein